MNQAALPELPKHKLAANNKTGPDAGKNLEEVTPYVNPTYYLEAVQRETVDSDDEIDFNQVHIEEFEDYSDSDAEETLEKAIRTLNEKNFFGNVEQVSKTEEPVSSLTKRPEVIDDYIRNFLSSKGLFKSLDSFQNEWYEFQQKGLLAVEDVNIVPDVYQKNLELAESLQKLRIDVENYKEIASKARATYDKLRKERDFHRMHHKRVVQEKNRLIGDIKRLKKHYESYEPTLKQLRNRYEVAMKEKMLTKLERDKLSSKLSALEENVKLERQSKETSAKISKILDSEPKEKTAVKREKEKEGSASQKEGNKSSKKSAQSPKDSSLPVDDRANPYGSMDLPVAKVDKLKQIHSVKAHSMAISSIKFHPKKMILATVSDDKLWKMWAFPSGELIMSGEGHKDWIADCDFHPRGAHLATASGDGTVKVWDFGKGAATLTLSDHTQAVWSTSFHDQGDFLTSCSMDHTAKLWDIHTGKCKQTFRGHVDSVNHVGFIPYTNNLFTCSGDKTLSIWDARSGLCTQTLYGHLNAINHVAFTLKGDTVASCDADGIVKFWDIRNVSELSSLEFGPEAANKIAFDPSGNILAVASNDKSTKLYNIREHTRIKDLPSDDAVQAVIFDKTAEFLVTAGSNCSFHIFQ